MANEWVNRRNGESAKRRTNVKTDEKKQNDRLNGRITETRKKAIKHFRDLDVYQNALETALRVYELSKNFPNGKRYALTDQMRRSSRSVCANIAEAWRKRRYTAAFFPNSATPKARLPKRKCTWSLRFVTATSVKIRPFAVSPFPPNLVTGCHSVFA